LNAPTLTNAKLTMVAVTRSVSMGKHVMINFFWHKDPIYLQSVIIHSANGGKVEGCLVEEYSVALQNGSEIQFVPHGNHIT
jgi:hypothetical protein